MQHPTERLEAMRAEALKGVEKRGLKHNMARAN